MEKYSNFEVKPFSFSELVSTKNNSENKTATFEFGIIKDSPFNSPKPDQQTIRQERVFESQTAFKIEKSVRESRGLEKQEKDDFETAVKAEVEQKLSVLKEEGFSKGFEKGKEEAFEKKQRELETLYDEKIEKIAEVINDVATKSSDLLVANKDQILEFINRITKWVILKEVSKEMYLEKLLEKLILELNEKRNLIVKVGRSNFSDMPEIITKVENRLGQLPNVRVEIISEVVYPGIILESDNGLIDGSLESIFENVDKIFEMVKSDVEG